MFSKIQKHSKNLIKSGKENSATVLRIGKEKAKHAREALSVPVKTRVKESVQFIDESIGVTQVRTLFLPIFPGRIVFQKNTQKSY